MHNTDHIRAARAKAREAIGKLEAASEFWPASGSLDGLNEYQRQVKMLETFIFEESDIA